LPSAQSLQGNTVAKSNSARRAPLTRPQTTSPAPAATPTELEQLIHERIRLGIISALAANDSLTFTDLKRLLDTSDGNLSVHARKLEDARYITCRKGYEGRVPRTEFRLTPAGRRALERYLDHMEAIIRATRER
jgi:DNA-binding MarR family transcriptional regulator